MRRIGLVCVLGLAVMLGAAEAWGFGKNKISFELLRWRVHKTEHLDIYYYPEAAARIPWFAQFAEAAYLRIAGGMGLRESPAPQLRKGVPIVLYRNRRELDQTFIFTGFITEGIRGFSEPLRGRMVIPLDGPQGELEQLIVHELTHVLMYRAIGFTALQQWGAALPLWFTEGLAEHHTGTWAAWDEGILRDAVLRGELTPPSRLFAFDGLQQPFLGYAIGHAAVDLLEAKHGPRAISKILAQLKRQRVKRLDRAIYQALGVRPDELDQELHHSLLARYAADITLKPDISQPWPNADARSSDVGAVLSPAGELLAYITNRGGPLQIVIGRFRDGQKFQQVTRTEAGEEGFLAEGRPLVWSPDGNSLAYITPKNGRDLLTLWDLDSRRVQERIDLGLERVYSPAFHPDGLRLAVAGELNGQPDLFLYDRQSGRLAPLTRDPHYDTEPTWSPDGARVVYSSERAGRFHLIELDVASGVEKVLLSGNGVPYSAVWTRDGRSLIVVLDRNAIENLYQLDRSSGQLQQRTWALGRAGAPCPLPDGHLLYVEYRTGRYALRKVGPPLPGNPAWTQSPPPLAGFVSSTSASEAAFYLEAATPSWKLGVKDLVWGAGFTEDQRLQLGVGVTFSDLFAERQFSLRAGTDGPLEEFSAAYSSVRRRFETSLGLGHRRQYVFFDGTRLRESEQWLRLGAVYGLDREHRLGLQLSFTRTENSEAYGVYGTEPREALSLRAEFVGDRVQYGSFGPVSGSRYRVTGLTSLPVSDWMSHHSLAIESRTYAKLMRRWTLAARFVAGFSFGPDPLYSSLGGSESLRGFELGQFTGEKVLLGNLELRFPLVDGIRFAPGWNLRGLRGAVFADVGTAFDRWGDVNLWDTDPEFILQDLKVSIGARASLRVSRLDFRFSAGWATDFQSIASEPELSFTVGTGPLF